MAESSEHRPRALASLGRRLLSAAVLVVLVVWVAMRGGWLFAGGTGLWALCLLHEYQQMARDRGQRRHFATLLPMVLALFALAKLSGPGAVFGAFTILSLGLLAFEALRGRIAGASAHVAEKVLALFYLGLLPAYWILLRELPRQMALPADLYPAGGRLFLYAAAVTWLSDTFAYFLGSLFGRHSLGTAVSPRKSIEGAAAAVLGGVLTAWLLAPYWASFLSPGEALALGLALSVAGLLGDLFESLLKRDAAVKDTGRLIPGHGGFLDRVDSLLFTIPVLYAFMVFYKSRGGTIF